MRWVGRGGGVVRGRCGVFGVWDEGGDGALGEGVLGDIVGAARAARVNGTRIIKPLETQWR